MLFLAFLLLNILQTLCASRADPYVLRPEHQVQDRKKPYKKFKRFIECQTCGMATESIYRVWLMSFTDSRFDEEQMYSLVMETCNPWSNIGVWITAIDLVLNPDTDQLQLISKADVGECNRECETIKDVCEDLVMENADEISEWMWKNQQNLDNAKLTEWVCPDSCDGLEGDPKVPNKLAKKHKIGEEEWTKMPVEEQKKRMDIFQQLQDEFKEGDINTVKHDL